jgi:hypothetical protein
MAGRVGVLLRHQVCEQGHREECKHAGLSKLLAAVRALRGKQADGDGVMLILFVLESPIRPICPGGTLFKCLDRASKEMDISNARQMILNSKLHLHSVHSLQDLVSQRRYLERQKPTSEARGRIRDR